MHGVRETTYSAQLLVSKAFELKSVGGNDPSPGNNYRHLSCIEGSNGTIKEGAERRLGRRESNVVTSLVWISNAMKLRTGLPWNVN